MDIEKYCGLMRKYGENYEEQARLNEELFCKCSKAEWQDRYRERAVKLSRLYEENEQIIKTVSEMMKEPLTHETAGRVWREFIFVFNEKRCPDLCLLAPILEQLRSYGEREGGYEWLIWSYHLASVCLLTFGAADNYLPFNIYQYMEKIIALKDKYMMIDNERARIMFFDAYSVLCSTDEGIKYLGVRKAYDYYREMVALWEDERVQALDGGNESIRQYIDAVRVHCANSIAIYLETSSPEEIKEYFFELSEAQFKKDIADKEELSQYDFFIYETHIHMMYVRDEISRREAIRLLFEYYKARIENFSDRNRSEKQSWGVGDLSMEELNFLLNAPIAIAEWAGKCGMDELPDEIISCIADGTKDVLYKNILEPSGRENELDIQLAEYCFAVLPFLRSAEEKEEWLSRLIVYRQLPTYIHCCVVKRLAEVIFEELYREKPALFCDVAKKLGSDKLAEFIGKCALFHDIGKNRIAGVINIQSRAIKDNEFAAIKTHPDLGYRFICEDPDFACYKDIVLGHHKFYNGQGGYPQDFDNTTSPYRSVIDLITICDCMDAATDVLGRNYKRAKTVGEVLAEFERDKGIRYNPDMVDQILSSERLKEKMEYIVSTERIEIAYGIYEKFLS